MGFVTHYSYEQILDDPDDYRPGTTYALVADRPLPDHEPVRTLGILFERCGVGERIPAHTHPQDEAIVIDAGEAEVTVDRQTVRVGAGAVIFIPGGVPHGTVNVGDRVLRLHGIFPTVVVGIEYKNRNPAPGTEADPPQPPSILDFSQGAWRQD